MLKSLKLVFIDAWDILGHTCTTTLLLYDGNMLFSVCFRLCSYDLAAFTIRSVWYCTAVEVLQKPICSAPVWRWMKTNQKKRRRYVLTTTSLKVKHVDFKTPLGLFLINLLLKLYIHASVPTFVVGKDTPHMVIVFYRAVLIFVVSKLMCTLTLSFPPLSSSLIFSRASTVLFKSLCKRRPKSLNMVEPPDRTMFCGLSRKGDEDYNALASQSAKYHLIISYILSEE